MIASSHRHNVDRKGATTLHRSVLLAWVGAVAAVVSLTACSGGRQDPGGGPVTTGNPGVSRPATSANPVSSGATTHVSTSATTTSSIAATSPGIPASGTSLAVPPDAASRPGCRADQYQLRLRDIPPTALRTLISSYMTNFSGEPCFHKLDIVLTIRDERGNPLAIDGNPSSVKVEGNMPDDLPRDPTGGGASPLSVGWTWENWCPTEQAMPLGPYRFEISDGSHVATLDWPSGPRCEESGTASRLSGQALGNSDDG